MKFLFRHPHRRRRWSPPWLALLLGILSCGIVVVEAPFARAGASEPARPFVAQAAAPTARQLVAAGQRHYAAGDYAAAARLWQTAADQFRAAQNRLDQARSLNRAALAYRQLGAWQAADDAIAASLALWAAPGEATDSRQQQVLGQAWGVRGSLLLAQSQATAAFEAFQQAAAYYQAAEEEDEVLRHQINQVHALQAAGFNRRALAMLESVHPPLSERPASEVAAAGLRALGELKRIMGDYAASRAILEQSLHMAQQLADEPAVAAAQLSLGTTAAAAGSPEPAGALFQQVRQSRATPALTVRSAVAQLGMAASQGNTTAVDELLPQVALALTDLPPGRLQTYAYIDGAAALAQMPQTAYQAAAAEWLAQARQQAQAQGDLLAESYALGTLGEIYQRHQQLRQAQTLSERALALATQAQAPEVSYRWNAQLGALQRQTGQAEAAIDHYTAAIHTLQSLRTDLVAIDADVRFNFRETVEPIYRELVDLLTAPGQGSQADLQQARGVIESLQLAELENYFREACLAVSQEIDQVVDSAAQPTAVLYPIILADRLEVILKLPHQPLTHYATPIAQADLEAQLEQLRADLVLPYTLRTVQSRAAQLYDWLIKPIEADLAASQIDTLVFVLDGALRNLPMGLLYNGTQYLIEQYGIAIAPGLQLVDPQPLEGPSLTAITAGLSQARHGFSALPYVETEVKEVQDTLASQVLLNQNFTAANLARTIQESPFPVVHLATHGQFSSDPEKTFILAWDKPILLKQLNQILRSSEQSRESAIELLVLSACETAAGDQRAVLGLAGVTVRAGARSALASLWSLDDETTAILVDEFYEALKVPQTTRAQALQTAQTALLNNPRYAHPRYWAPYVLIGNWL